MPCVPSPTYLTQSNASAVALYMLIFSSVLLLLSLTCQTFHSAKGEEKSGNLPIPFWFAEFGIILRHVNGMLILCCHVQCTCMRRFW